MRKVISKIPLVRRINDRSNREVVGRIAVEINKCTYHPLKNRFELLVYDYEVIDTPEEKYLFKKINEKLVIVEKDKADYLLNEFGPITSCETFNYALENALLLETVLLPLYNSNSEDWEIFIE